MKAKITKSWIPATEKTPRIDHYYLQFRCPGCNQDHHIELKPGSGWVWNNDLELPSLSRPTGEFISAFWWIGCAVKDPKCFASLSGGFITFGPESDHGLAGKTVLLPEID